MQVHDNNTIEIVLASARADEDGSFSAADGVRVMRDDMKNSIKINRDHEGLIGIFHEDFTTRKEHGRPDTTFRTIRATHITGAWDDAASDFLQNRLATPADIKPSAGFKVQS